MINEKLDVLTEETKTIKFVETLKIKDFFNKIIKEGGSYEIKTPGGFKPIGDLYLKMEKKIFSIKLDTGEELIASEDHLIETETENFNEDSEVFDRIELLNGCTFIRLKNLKINDLVKTINGTSKLVHKGYLGVETTYDLEVLDDKHVYTTNDIISHNTGKTAIVEGLALKIVERKCPRILFDKRVVSLDLASLVAGTKYRGQFEERMKGIMQELEKVDDIILFIDEIHTMVGAGNSSGSLDASNILKPALARGEIQCIGATTLDEYRENIEKDGALARRFQIVLVEPPSKEETLIILNNIKGKYEDHHKVSYTNEAIDACVKLADRYITDREQPDKSIDIMDEVGARTQVNIKPPQEIIDLEAKIAEINNKKIDVVKSQRYEDAAKLRDEEKKYQEKLEHATNEWSTNLDKVRPIINEDDVAKVVSMVTGVPVTKISQTETEKLRNMDKELKGKVIGQDVAIDKIVKAIKRNRVGIKNQNKPICSFMFLGPTGVGKTHLVKMLTESIFGSSDSLIRIDMSEYMEKHTVSKLIGSPPGYVGHEDGGQLTEKVRRKPFSVILFDEIEKAHPDIFNILLQVFDEGHLTDSLGRKIDFKNCLIIMTSNVGARKLQEFGTGIGFGTKAKLDNTEEIAEGVIQDSLKKAFSPEFLNRLDDVIVFKSLDMEDIRRIVEIPLTEVVERVKEMGYNLKLDETLKEYLIEKGYDEKYGARPLNRAIQKYVEDPISEKILEGELSLNDTVTIFYDTKEEDIKISIKKTKVSRKK
jgi:ATP-dependent Clp protease ATP-binding subunit ClpC